MLRMLKEDEEFRYAVAGLLGLEEILKRLDRNEQELVRLREDMAKMFEKHEERFARIEEEIRRIWQEIERLREDMMKGFDAMNRRISALGARWGLESEEGLRSRGGPRSTRRARSSAIRAKWRWTSRSAAERSC
jgi:hypothetical protein